MPTDAENLALQYFLRNQSRHDARDLESTRHLESEHAHWAATPLLERRIGWRQSGCPRFLYKYRPPPVGDGKKRLEDILLRHQLWMADASTYEDPMDSQIEYRVTLSGDALFRRLAQHQRRTALVSRFKAERMVSVAVANDPDFLQTMFRANNQAILSVWGICSLAANARDERLWDEYAEHHAGVCFQFQPAQDFRAFIDLQEIKYSDEDRTIENPFAGDGSRKRRFELLMTKYARYAFEDEWRIVGKLKANQPHPFLPQALTGVIIGANADDGTRQVVRDLLEQRKSATGFQPVLYDADKVENRVKFRRVR